VSSNYEAPDSEVPAKARTRTFSASYKARILAEYETLDKAGKGALLRREGLYSSLVIGWKQQRDIGAREALSRPVGVRRPIPRIGRMRCYVGRMSACAPSWTRPGGLSRCRESSPRCWVSSRPTARVPGASPHDDR
jgi:hypothetical protein